MARKYARIFVREHYLFPRSEQFSESNCELRGTDNLFFRLFFANFFLLRSCNSYNSSNTTTTSVLSLLTQLRLYSTVLTVLPILAIPKHLNITELAWSGCRGNHIVATTISEDVFSLIDFYFRYFVLIDIF